MIDAGAAIGLRHWRGRWARNRAEKWIGGIVEDVRNHRLATDEGSAPHMIALHRDRQGQLLNERIEAVELMTCCARTLTSLGSCSSRLWGCTNILNVDKGIRQARWAIWKVSLKGLPGSIL